MAAFRDSWQLTKATFRILRDHPVLVSFPLLAAACAVGLLAIFAFSLFSFFPASGVSYAHSGAGQAVLIGLFVALYVLLVFVGNFFVAALVGATMMAFRGEVVTVGKGIGFARQQAFRILGWSLIAATVGLLIRAITSRIKGFGGIAARLVAGATWQILTYFIIPVILFESAGPWASLKRSGSLFVKTFGRTLLSNVYVGLIVLGIFGMGFVPFVIGLVDVSSGEFNASDGSLIFLAVVIWAFAAILGTTLQGILRTALYRYATTGAVTPGIVPEEYRVGSAGRF